MNEKQLQRAMKLIAIAGDAKSMAIRAMSVAEDNHDIAEAKKILKEAQTTLHKAHNIQTAWMTAEMNGEKVEKTILLIHSQDHFMAADIMMTVADKFIGLAEQLELEHAKGNEADS
ncbi:PTS lactose/cellobiose transporter subunit IIA [Lacticaseibacillus chiayiensis]|uniref:PTS lactose/cellobiose transporter subunit IIA n=1 Tax=Lacticaseibacillus chiayiensis TaxID=2100821 RepID=UPI003C742753